MYLFARSRVVNPAHGRAAVATAIEAGERAAGIVGFPVFTWVTAFGPDPLAAVWSGRVERLADLVAADDALAADASFGDWVEQRDELFLGTASDVVSQVVHGAPSGPPKAFVTATRSVCANGAISEAMGYGVELAETAMRLTGHDVLFVAAVAGTYGGVGWIVGADDLAQMEAGNATLAGSDEWLKLVDRAGHAFLPGATSSIVLRRLP
jgi:hypothetical protein